MKKKMDKTAWLRVVEAFLGIIIIAMVLIIIVSRDNAVKDNSQEIHDMQDSILEIISKNDNIRNIILTTLQTENNIEINNEISKLASRSWNYSTKICPIEQACGMTLPQADIYVTERIIVSDLDTYQPRKLRFFVWMKE